MTKPIYKEEFKKTLHDVHQLDKNEKAYVKESFGKSLNSGLTQTEFKKEVSRLKKEHGDVLDSTELKRMEDAFKDKF